MKRTLVGIGIGFLFIFCLGLSYSNREIETTDKILITDSSDDTYLNKWSQVETFIEDNIDAIENDLSLSSTLTVTDSAYFSDDVTIANDAVIDSALYVQTINFDTLSGGTADSLYIDFDPDLPGLVAGLIVEFVADSANTGATTITIDGTEKNIFEASDISELDANDIRAGMFVSLRYDGTQWQQISQSGN